MNPKLMLGTLALALAGSAGLAAAPASTSLRATATLRDASGQPQGTATFQQMGAGVQVTVEVRGLPPGGHGMHVHQNGSCQPGVDAATNTVVPFGAAGEHFDPGMSHNHDGPQAPDKTGHAGDLPMLMVGADGVGRASFSTDKISLTGMNGVLNRALVVHQNPDDYKTDPAGLSGMRERCGVITRTNFNVHDYTLPDHLAYPEGLTYDARRGLLFTGSAANGTIYAINAQTGAVSKFAEGGSLGRRSALGMQVDPQGRLWVAGGAQGTLSLLSPVGMLLKVLEAPRSPTPYLNDLALAPDGSAYVTDSARPVLYRVDPQMRLTAWLDLSRTPIRYGPGINLDGIVVTPDGRYLLTNQLNTGDLWRVDLRTKAVRKVMGGLMNSDGLLLDGHTLYAARNRDGVVSKVQLSADYGSGTVVMEEPLSGLRFPSALVQMGNELVVTQSQLDRLQSGTPPEVPFRLTRFKRF